jgi:hypothetical protein
MKENKSTGPVASRGKERRDEKTFKIPISNGIFEHYGRLKDARWLLDLFIDWTTKEVPGANGRLDGIVLGGKPIRDEDTACAFRGQCSARTTRRWRQRLSRYGYISQKRTPVGYVIRVMKSKKWVRLEAMPSGVIGQKWPDRSAKNGRSEVPDVAGQNGHDRQFRTTDHGRSNKDSAVQGRDKAVEEATTAAALLSKEGQNPEWKTINLAPCGSEQFRKAWKEIYGKSLTDERDSDVMERCIIACRQSCIDVPRSFYEAKRRVEGGVSEDRSDPHFRMAEGAQGVRPEMMR